MGNSSRPSRNLHELSSLSTREWTKDELAYHHNAMSELSPWLNAQGTHIHSQIIQEIESRGGLT